MRWLGLYLRCRGVPAASIAAATTVITAWTLWTIWSDTRQVGTELATLTIALLVAVTGGTLAGPDEALDRTASISWPPRRAIHLLVTLAALALLLALTLVTDTRFTPFELAVRDVIGLLGLTALGAAVLGAHRAWFLPLAGTLLALMFWSYQHTAVGRLISWPLQPADATAAALTAAALGLAGAVAHIVRGSAPRATDATLT
ncbi:hypothetical protein HCB17_20380 [Salinispora arenicola]|uniref:hypothetical protein n=1 Tax=Salinispora arenicola TaxID=168697 RepID=UPI001430632F|nr:hypothetical protein [Salinispora arenicola]NIL43230.1 hypothetical protein [Salinispora arenicola]